MSLCSHLPFIVIKLLISVFQFKIYLMQYLLDDNDSPRTSAFKDFNNFVTPCNYGNRT